MTNVLDKLQALFVEWCGMKANVITPLPVAGSHRRYWRLAAGTNSVIGAWNPVPEENEAFFHFTDHFHKNGLHVPELYKIDPGREVYLLEDLGDNSLFSLIEHTSDDGKISGEVIELYRKSLSELILFQVTAGKGIDYRYCYPNERFDKRSIMWDLNYFKYYFLKLHISFHEGRLETDFEQLADYLLQAGSDYFMFRDFQARNIFIKNNKPYFIDYQGGRKGPLQYDVASLLFQVKADLPFELRTQLLEHYLDELSLIIPFDRKEFERYYNGFVLLRLLQVLGAYGFRGLIEKKPHFLASIPYALKNLDWWLNHINFPLEMPELRNALKILARIDKYKHHSQKTENEKLTVTIKSFSYKKGYPEDDSGNGGGFVFDCRALPNPGREEKYRAYNGKDQIIIDYLKDKPEVLDFLENAEKIISSSVENYLERGFKDLSVNFGCTGGQHRSVYCTETMAKRLSQKYSNVEFKVEHLNI